MKSLACKRRLNLLLKAEIIQPPAIFSIRDPRTVAGDRGESTQWQGLNNMAENGGSFWSQHLGNIIVGVIGAIGAIAAAVIPLMLNRSDPAPAEVIAPDKVATRTPVQAQDDRPQTLRDLERLQGTWESVSREAPEEIDAKMAARAKAQGIRGDKPPVFLWKIDGNALAVRIIRIDGSDGPMLRGTFGLREDRNGQARLFDFNGKASTGAEVTWAGVYEFEEDLLRVCYRTRHGNDEADPGRAVAFHTDLKRGGGSVFTFKKRPAAPP